VEDPRDFRNYHQFNYLKMIGPEDSPTKAEDSPKAEDTQEEDTDTLEAEDTQEEVEDHREDRQVEDGDHPHLPYHKQTTGDW